MSSQFPINYPVIMSKTEIVHWAINRGSIVPGHALNNSVGAAAEKVTMGRFIRVASELPGIMPFACTVIELSLNVNELVQLAEQGAKLFL